MAAGRTWLHALLLLSRAWESRAATPARFPGPAARWTSRSCCESWPNSSLRFPTKGGRRTLPRARSTTRWRTSPSLSRRCPTCATSSSAMLMCMASGATPCCEIWTSSRRPFPTTGGTKMRPRSRRRTSCVRSTPEEAWTRCAASSSCTMFERLRFHNQTNSWTSSCCASWTHSSLRTSSNMHFHIVDGRRTQPRCQCNT
mmetsp:Transcript_29569/g.69625  ORF Transcript_29569/g.69625 Transcript_29569/m.69625 type:complete len:200 (-) Transcript_29569:326-925(-)